MADVVGHHLRLFDGGRPVLDPHRFAVARVEPLGYVTERIDVLMAGPQVLVAQAGLTLDELARQCGLSQPFLSQIETGRNSGC